MGVISLIEYGESTLAAVPGGPHAAGLECIDPQHHSAAFENVSDQFTRILRRRHHPRYTVWVHDQGRGDLWVSLRRSQPYGRNAIAFAGARQQQSLATCQGLFLLRDYFGISRLYIQERKCQPLEKSCASLVEYCGRAASIARCPGGPRLCGR